MEGRVALIGKPLRRRHGAVMHNAAFAACGMRAQAELVELDEVELPSFVESLKKPMWIGFQVTSPYKRSIMGLLDHIEDDAEIIGAVNSGIREPNATLTGFNTDMPGWLDAVRRELSFDIRGSRVLLLGAGGVAHAIAYACVAQGADALTIADQMPEAAARLAKRLRSVDTQVTSTRTGTDWAHASLLDCDLLINATTVGMTVPGPLVDVSACQPHTRVFDAVFSPPMTELVRAARARGLMAVNGGGMLVSQAAIAFERWTGRTDVYDVMEAAVRPLLMAMPGSHPPD